MTVAELVDKLSYLDPQAQAAVCVRGVEIGETEIVAVKAEDELDVVWLFVPEASCLHAEDMPDCCECDNTHEANDTVCRWCWYHGRRRPSDPEIAEEP